MIFVLYIFKYLFVNISNLYNLTNNHIYININ